jgi:geranylgeranyl diphosphate synthase type I
MFPGLSAFGQPLGDAFQMRDDVIGAFGDAAVTGKPVGDDLREGKPTPLLALATERATADQKAVLAGVGARELDAGAVAEIQQVLLDTGALAAVERRIDELAAAALDALTGCALTAEARGELATLAAYVVSRRQ